MLARILPVQNPSICDHHHHLHLHHVHQVLNKHADEMLLDHFHDHVHDHDHAHIYWRLEIQVIFTLIQFGDS